MVRGATRNHENQLRSCFPIQAALGWGTLVRAGFEFSEQILYSVLDDSAAASVSCVDRSPCSPDYMAKSMKPRCGSVLTSLTVSLSPTSSFDPGLPAFINIPSTWGLSTRTNVPL